MLKTSISLFAILCVLTIATAFAQNDPRPNIVLVLTDDYGWPDTGC